MQLTQHFSLAEMTRSSAALRRGIDNTPPPPVLAALTALCVEVLEPLRAGLGQVAITSGYRSPAVNKAVGGAKSSQHLMGEAADLTVPGHSNLEVCQWIQRHLHYDQLIYEFGEAGWVHVSWRPGGLRHQELTAKRLSGRTQYLPGLIA